MAMMQRWRELSRGQMTVEFVIAFPVMLSVAAIAINVVLFLSECAAFDRLAPEAVRVHASARAYGEDAAQARVAIQEELTQRFSRDYLSFDVESYDEFGGLQTYVLTLEFEPTLFGINLKSKIFGVELPRITHQSIMTINPYRPGVLL